MSNQHHHHAKHKAKKSAKSNEHKPAESNKASDHEDDNSDDDTEQETADGKPRIKKSIFSMSSFDAEKDLPIVYNENYNMSLIGVEVLHQFDTKKYGKFAEILSDIFSDTHYARFPDTPVEEGTVPRRRLQYLTPNRPANRRELALHHSEDYLRHIHDDKSLIARITETWALNLVPMFLLKKRILTPIKWQVAGTIFATHLAMQHGWAINLGGGFHQASANDGETFCLFSDILISIRYIWRKHPLQRFLIIDLDAHQATGLERDLVDLHKKRRQMIHMLDIYNETVQPPDQRALMGIDTKVELARFTGDDTYMKKLKQALGEVATKFKPTVIIYVAGQDVLKDDQLGLLNLSDEALRKRDEMVFSLAAETLKIPIVMLLAGGYLARGPKVMAESIRHLFSKGLIWGGHRSGARSLSRPRRNKSNSSGPQRRKGSSSDLHKSQGKKSGSKSHEKRVVKPQPPLNQAKSVTSQGQVRPQHAHQTKPKPSEPATKVAKQDPAPTYEPASSIVAKKSVKQPPSALPSTAEIASSTVAKKVPAESGVLASASKEASGKSAAAGTSHFTTLKLTDEENASKKS